MVSCTFSPNVHYITHVSECTSCVVQVKSSSLLGSDKGTVILHSAQNVRMFWSIHLPPGICTLFASRREDPKANSRVVSL